MKTQKLTLFGSIFAAIMASSCCWLPFALLAFGISGAALSTIISRYRNAFLVISFVLLSVAFYFAYKPINNKEENEEECCRPQSTQKISLKTINRIMLWVVTSFIIAFAFLPLYMHLLPFGYSEVNALKSLCPEGFNDEELMSKIDKHEKFLNKKAQCCEKDHKKTQSF